MPVVIPRAASTLTQKIGAKTFAVLLHHAVNAELLQPLGGGRHADESAPEPGHEIDGGGRDVLRGHDKVAFVLAVGVVHDDDHFAFAQIGDDGFNFIERIFHSAKIAYSFEAQMPADSISLFCLSPRVPGLIW